MPAKLRSSLYIFLICFAFALNYFLQHLWSSLSYRQFLLLITAQKHFFKDILFHSSKSSYLFHIIIYIFFPYY